MSKLIDQILVIDVESTCWEGPPPQGQESEIIQIGICPVDVRSLQRLDKRSVLVKPGNSQIGDFCSGLTELTADMFESAPSFSAPLRVLKSECKSKDRLWASWGDYDRRQFERQCASRKLGFPFGPSHLNVKSLFAAAMGLDHEVGLDEAYDKLKMTMEGRHHRGDDDAWNIAGILVLMLQQLRKAFGASEK
jgi:inhibitor of KinA sporulation pathway (predicted exonuclease)